MKYLISHKLFEGKKGKGKNILILHGWPCSKEDNFYLWMKRKLKNMGHTVYLPNLPNTDNPIFEDQVNHILKKYSNIDIIIGHSFGGCVSLKLIEELDYVESLFLVTTSLSHEEITSIDKWEYDLEDIKSKVENIYVLCATEDVEVPRKDTYSMAKKLGVDVIEFDPEENHACGTKEPELLSIIKKYIS